MEVTPPAGVGTPLCSLALPSSHLAPLTLPRASLSAEEDEGTQALHFQAPWEAGLLVCGVPLGGSSSSRPYRHGTHALPT